MVTDPRQVIQDAGSELHTAALALSETLQRVADQMRRVGEELRAGTTVIDALAEAEVGKVRKQTAEGIDRFEQARHKLRLAAFGAAQAEGASTAELARVWELPMSLVDRFARQARANPPNPH
jgi:hypothetical protein